MTRVFILLQNAWAKDQRSADAFREDRRVWLYATARSRSGQRLSVMLGDDCCWNESYWFDNTTPEVGVGSSGAKLKPDIGYVTWQLYRVQPALVVTCGQQAEEVALKLWDDDLLCVPHPASRLLTNELLKRAGVYVRYALEREGIGRLALRQERDAVRLVDFKSG